MRTGPSEPGDDERGTATKARRCLELNRQLLGPDRAAFAERLVVAGQGALFCKLPTGSSDDDSDRQDLLELLDNLSEADAKYPGGVESYISGAVALLGSAGLDEKQILRYSIGVKDEALHFFPPGDAGPAVQVAAVTPSLSAAAEEGPHVDTERLSVEPAKSQAASQAPLGSLKSSQPPKRADMLNLRCWAKFWCVCLR